MVNREAPNRALPYIQEATAPLRKFLSSEVQHIAPAVVTTWTGQVIEGLTQKCVWLFYLTACLFIWVKKGTRPWSTKWCRL